MPLQSHRMVRFLLICPGSIILLSSFSFCHWRSYVQLRCDIFGFKRKVKHKVSDIVRRIILGLGLRFGLDKIILLQFFISISYNLFGIN